MKTYLYSGPLSSATLTVDGVPHDVILNPGRPVDLPEDHPYTLKLLARKLVSEVVPSSIPAVKTKSEKTHDS